MRICLHDKCYTQTKRPLCGLHGRDPYPAMGLLQLDQSIRLWEGLRSVFPQATVELVLERRRNAQAILSVILDQDNGAR